MVEISLSGSGEGPGWVTAPGYSTAALSPWVRVRGLCQIPRRERPGGPIGGGFKPAELLHPPLTLESDALAVLS